ncbi:MAG: AAA family ATPase [Pseudomonadota bacterium]
MLPLLDTGIEYIGGEEMPFDHIPIPEPLKLKLKTELQEGMTVRWLTEPINERFLVTRKGGELKAKKLVSFHRNINGEDIKFEMQQESDGTQRTIDLLPAFLEMAAADSDRVFVIDELDRSMHTLLTRRLLEGYLFACGSKCRSQLLFATHDVLLMDQDLLRRDEMWVTERDRDGSSTLFSFSEYKDVRNDKDIRKSYLQGRLGGIPRILMGTLCSNNENKTAGEQL